MRYRATCLAQDLADGGGVLVDSNTDEHLQRTSRLHPDCPALAPRPAQLFEPAPVLTYNSFNPTASEFGGRRDRFRRIKG
jgi:hypothetical protein